MHNTSSKPSDREIIQRIIDGDADAFAHILTKYKDHVMGVVNRHVPYDQVEETAHDAFIRAYQSLATFSGEDNFRHWLSSIAVRTCYDFWRERYKAREIPMSSLTEKHREWLENVISDTSDKAFSEHGSRKEVYLEGQTVKEAAELLGWTTANVKVRSFRSRRKLHKLLSGPIGEEMIQ